MSVALGRIPELQANALPLYTPAAAVAAVDGDTIVVVGARTFKRWSPAATGINGNTGNVADPRTPANGVYLLSNWLDMSGMVYFTAAMGIHYPAAFAIQNWAVRLIPAAVQAGNAAVEPVPAPPGPNNRNLTSAYMNSAYASPGSCNFAATVGANNASASVSWHLGIEGAAGPLGTLGPCRVLLTSTTGADPVNIFLTLYASS
jgi:hypothetical protein